MVRGVLYYANKIKQEQLARELNVTKFSSDSDSDPASDDDSDDDTEEPSSSAVAAPKKTTPRKPPSKVEKPKAKGSAKKSQLEKVKAMDSPAVKRSPKKGTPTKKSEEPSSSGTKLKAVPKNYFDADYESPKASSSKASSPRASSSKGTPKSANTSLAGTPGSIRIPHQGKDLIKISMVKNLPDGSQESYKYGAVSKTTRLSQLIFNLPPHWGTRRTDIYSVKGVVIKDIENSTLEGLGLKSGGVIDSVSRGTSG